MTYAELLADIKTLSKRGDIDDIIALALRMTTRRCHAADYFWRDHAEVDALFGPTSVASIDISNVVNFPFFRQINYVQYLDPTSGALGLMLEEIQPANVFDNDNAYKVNCWYLSGTNLNINFQYQTSGARIGYWKNPDVAAATYNSWIADVLPDILVQGSLAYIYNTTGKQEEARSLNQLVGFDVNPRAGTVTLLDQLKGSNIRGSSN